MERDSKGNQKLFFRLLIEIVSKREVRKCEANKNRKGYILRKEKDIIDGR